MTARVAIWPISAFESGPAAVGNAGRAQRAFRRWLLPSFSDWLFLALMVWLFMTGAGWSGLLADGDTGWHIRTGEFVLDRHELPRHDLFSFSKPNQPWYAWEWLSDVIFALFWRGLGLKGVVLLAGTVIAVYLVVLFRHMLWRGANVLVALPVCLLAAGASDIHFLARPHVFTLLLTAVSLWLLDRDRRQPDRAIWALVPLSALWANLHAGFLALLGCLALVIAGEAAEAFLVSRSAIVTWICVRRHALLVVLCGVASLANPYGIKLYQHARQYLASDWIRDAVDEFQSPKFRSESALHFEVLLFASLIAAASLLRRRKISDALLVIAWAHAALVSVRHVPIFAIVVSPILAAEATAWWNAWAGRKPARSIAGILDRVAADVSGGFRRVSVWPAAVILALAIPGAPGNWPRQFPPEKFPVRLIERHSGKLAGARVFTSDQWSDYLLYRFYPKQRVFIDGRSDFYGPELGKRYLRTAYGHPGWRGTLDGYAVRFVLAPQDWPLCGLLRQVHSWRLLEEDARAALFERNP